MTIICSQRASFAGITSFAALLLFGGSLRAVAQTINIAPERI